MITLFPGSKKTVQKDREGSLSLKLTGVNQLWESVPETFRHLGTFNLMLQYFFDRNHLKATKYLVYWNFFRIYEADIT